MFLIDIDDGQFFATLSCLSSILTSCTKTTQLNNQTFIYKIDTFSVLLKPYTFAKHSTFVS